MARPHVDRVIRLFVEVDGGIDADTIAAAAEAGPTCSSPGSAVYSARRPGHGGFDALRARDPAGPWRVDSRAS